MKLTKSMLIVTLASGMLWAQAPANPSTQPQSKNPAPASKNVPPSKSPAHVTKPAAAVTPAKAPAKTPASASAATAAKAKAKPAVQAKAKPAVPEKAKPVVQAKAAQKPAAKAPMARAAVKPVEKPKVVAAKPVAVKPVAHRPEARVAVKKSPEPAKVAEVKPASVKEKTTLTHVGKMRDPFVSPVVRTGGNLGSGCDTGKRCLVVDQIVLKGIVKSPAGFIAVVENPAKRAYFMRENDPVFNGKVVKITGDTIVFQEEVTDKLGKQSMREVVKKVNAPVV